MTSDDRNNAEGCVPSGVVNSSTCKQQLIYTDAKWFNGEYKEMINKIQVIEFI